MTLGNKIFITADLHFNHKGILSMERKQFSSIEAHNEYIIEQYNKVVGENDTCYILGDVGFIGKKGGTLTDLSHLVHRLNGHKILIKGNHDVFTDQEAIKQLGFVSVQNGPIYLPYSQGKIILSHEPVQECLNNPYCINVHGHLHGSNLKLDNFYNVNISNTNYRPVPVSVFKKIARKKCWNRQETYGNEWYYSLYKKEN